MPPRSEPKPSGWLLLLAVALGLVVVNHQSQPAPGRPGGDPNGPPVSSGGGCGCGHN